MKLSALTPFFAIEKRIRFIMSSSALSLLLLISTFFFFDKAWLFIPICIVSVYLLTYFALLEGIKKNEWITLFFMPIMVTISFYLFYFLFPVRWLTRIPFIIFYGVSIYAMLLVSNIFNVGREKSLQLYRAAFSVNYFYQSLVVFLFVNIILSLKLNFFLSSLSLFVLGWGIATHLFWSIKLDLIWEKQVLQFGLLMGLIMGEVSLISSFIPLQNSITALFVSAVFYSLGGFIYLHLDSRLFKETIREYIIVLAFVLIIVLFTINW